MPASADITFCISATKPSHINGFAVSCPSIQEYSIDPIPGAMYTWTLSDGGSILSSVGNKISVNWTGIGVHKLSVYASSICKVKMNDSTSIDIKIINPVVPSDVTNLFPVSSTVITRFPFSLSWLASGANEVYDLYVWPEGTQQPTMPIIVDTNGVAYLIFNGYQLPGFAPGKKYLWKVITKNSCLQSNGISSSFVISELPNLVLQSVEAPDNTFSGNSIDITIKVLNKGKASTLSTRWTDAVYLSRDTIFNASFDVYVGGVGNLSALDSGQEYLNTFRLNLPQNIIGDYHLIVVTNVFNTLTEVTITDNSIIKPILINLTPPPDLQVTSVIPPNEAFSGQFIDITYTVKNKGTGQTNSAQWDDYLYISPDPVFDRNTAFKLGERSHNQLKAIRLSGLCN
ncbi:MAG: hypothetical protein IPI77_18355 [Saprospiraceae bacterium]|nr:hypothetical protein [Saprospiraceae bacterium]